MSTRASLFVPDYDTSNRPCPLSTSMVALCADSIAFDSCGFPEPLQTFNKKYSSKSNPNTLIRLEVDSVDSFAQGFWSL